MRPSGTSSVTGSAPAAPGVQQFSQRGVLIGKQRNPPLARQRARPNPATASTHRASCCTKCARRASKSRSRNSPPVWSRITGKEKVLGQRQPGMRRGQAVVRRHPGFRAQVFQIDPHRRRRARGHVRDIRVGQDAAKGFDHHVGWRTPQTCPAARRRRSRRRTTAAHDRAESPGECAETPSDRPPTNAPARPARAPGCVPAASSRRCRHKLSMTLQKISQVRMPASYRNEKGSRRSL